MNSLLIKAGSTTIYSRAKPRESSLYSSCKTRPLLPPYLLWTFPRRPLHSKIATCPSRPSNPCWSYLYYTTITFVKGPVFINFIEVPIIEVFVQRSGLFVVKLAEALKLIVDPVALIGLDIGLVVKNAVSLHLVLAPLSIITASVLIKEFSLAVSHSVEFVSFIPASHLEVLLDKTRLELELAMVSDLRSAG